MAMTPVASRKDQLKSLGGPATSAFARLPFAPAPLSLPSSPHSSSPPAMLLLLVIFASPVLAAASRRRGVLPTERKPSADAAEALARRVN